MRKEERPRRPRPSYGTLSYVDPHPSHPTFCLSVHPSPTPIRLRRGSGGTSSSWERPLHTSSGGKVPRRVFHPSPNPLFGPGYLGESEMDLGLFFVLHTYILICEVGPTRPGPRRRGAEGRRTSELPPEGVQVRVGPTGDGGRGNERPMETRWFHRPDL